jgi:iron complex outermembrane receptor protein
MRTVLLICCLLRIAVAQTVHGHVFNAKGEPVAGAVVRVLNTDAEATTGPDGAFILAGVASSRTAGVGSLYVTAPGFASRIVTNGELDIRLTPAIRQLDDIVVTAGKKEESARDLPLSITTLNARAAQPLWAMEDLRDEVSNLYAASPGDGRDVMSIRGVTSTSYDPAVTTYVDGVSAMSLDSYIPQLFDVDRIEVLKGPQGTLYGRNAMGGVINILTRPPSNQATGFAEANLGNYHLERYTAGLQLPLVKDRLFFSGAVLFEGRHGFYTNDYTGTDFDRQHRFGGNYTLRYLAGPHWSIEGNFKHLENRNDGAFPLAVSPAQALADPYHVDQNAVTTMVDNTVNASLVARYSGRFTFSTQTAYASNDRYYQQPIDGDFSPADAVSIVNNYGKPWNKVRNVTEELRFGNAPHATGAAGAWDWTAGLYGFYRDIPNKQGTHFGKDAALVGSPDSNYTIVNTSTQYGAGLAVYAQATRHFLHGWSITAGLRYDYEHNRENVAGEYVPDGAPGSAFPTQADTGASASYGAFSPMGAIARTIDRNTSVYVRYARGYRTGGLTAISGDPTQPPLYPYTPEYSNNWEAGWKGNYAHGRIEANAALFYCVINDVQVPTLELPAGVTVIRNAGRLESHGLDADIRALVLQGLTVTYGLGLTHATYDKLDLSENGTAEDLHGKTQVFTPDVTSTLAVHYTVAVTRTWNAHANAAWIYRGRQYFDLANTIEQGAYQTVNAGAGITHGDVTLDVWTRNLTKTRYIAYAYDFGATHLGDPCTFGVTLRWAGRL